MLLIINTNHAGSLTTDYDAYTFSGESSHNINRVNGNINVPGLELYVPPLSYYAGGNPSPSVVRQGQCCPQR